VGDIVTILATQKIPPPPNRGCGVHPPFFAGRGLLLDFFVTLAAPLCAFGLAPLGVGMGWGSLLVSCLVFFPPTFHPERDQGAKKGAGSQPTLNYFFGDRRFPLVPVHNRPLALQGYAPFPQLFLAGVGGFLPFFPWGPPWSKNTWRPWNRGWRCASELW